MSFWEASFLWREAVVAAIAVSVSCALVGVYAILRRVVFLPAALSQTAGVGVALSFVLLAHLPAAQGVFGARPEVFALAITLFAAFGLGWMPEPRHLSREAIIGIVFVAASALVLLIGDKLPQESHDIDDVLFGYAVVVEVSRMWIAIGVCAAVCLVHFFLMRIFVLVSFDRNTARAHGVSVRWVDAALFLTLGLSIATGTWTIGALPVFAFTILPGAAALNLFHDMRLVFVTAVTLGAVSAFLGYWAAWQIGLPTGPSMVATAFLGYAVSEIAKRFRRCRCGEPV